ncbi:unnamed protein product [Ascophyllum nodosum]
MFRILEEAAGRLGVNTPAQHAVLSGYISVVTGVTELVLSIMAGETEDSSSLLGISIMAFAEIVGSVLVLWRWRRAGTAPAGARGGASRQAEQLQEVYFAASIAFMTASLGAMLLHTSVQNLLDQESSGSATAGIMVSAYGATCSFLLWWYKRHYGNVLRSMVLLADAKCSFCVGLISLAVVGALVLERLWWWADSVTGICLAVYIMREGVHSMWEAREQFVAHLDGDEGLRLVPLMHERVGDRNPDEDTGLLEETM